MATQTFKERDWRPGTIRFIAVKIKLTDPNAARDSNYTTTPGASPILYLCDAGSPLTVDAAAGQNHPQGAGLLYNVDWGKEDGIDSGPDTNFYYPLIEDWDVDFGSTGFGDDISEANLSLSIVNHRYVWQKAHDDVALETDELHVRMSQLQSDYLWQGAKIIVAICAEQYDYNQDPSSDIGFHTHDSQTIFTGRIDDVVVTEKRIDIQATEDKAWNKSFPDAERPGGGSGPSVVTAVDYANAPRQSIGSVIPMVFTRRGPQTWGLTGAAEYVSPYNMDSLIPAVTTSFNADTTNFAKIIGDKWDSFGSAPSTSFAKYFIDVGDGRLAEVSGTKASSTTEHSLTYAHGDNAFLAIPCDRYQAHSGATNQANAIDGKSTTYATLTHSGSTVYLDLLVPFVSTYGKIAQFVTYCAFHTDSVGAGATDGTVCCEFGLWNSVTGDWALNAAAGGPATENPKQLTKAQINAIGTVVSVSTPWTKGAGSWDASDQPISNWRWEEFDGTNTANALYWRVRAIENGTTLLIIAGGVRAGFNPFVSSDFRSGPPFARTIKSGRSDIPSGRSDIPGGTKF